MDPISASNFNLRADLDRDKDRLRRLLGSRTSLSKYEGRNFKNLLPQIMGTAISASSHLVMGISLVFSAILIPQLEQKDSSIPSSREESSWTASVLMVVAPVGSILSGYLMDRFGRLNTLKISAVPGVIGWVLIGSAQNIAMLIGGRIISGLAMTLSTGPAVVYITEIARKDMRGSLLSLGPGFVSLGMILGYLQGWLMGWRTLAWICNVYVMIPFFLVFLIHESPLWLVSKGRDHEAKRSLSWLHKYQPQQESWDQSFAEVQLELLKTEHQGKIDKNRSTQQHPYRGFLKPTGYKPLMVMIALFFFQQFSGIYIFIFHSVIFFKAAGTTINPYMASVFIGVIRLLMSVVNPFLLRHCNRRKCIMTSALGMATCTFISGVFTYLIKHEKTTLSWVPVVFLLMYIMCAMAGLLTIPWTMTAELFPIEIRSMAHSISTSFVNVLMFLAVQSYATLDRVCGGSAGVQWFFSIICLLAFLYTLVFVPETHKKKLSEIEDYFFHNTIYFGQTKEEKEDDNLENRDADYPVHLVGDLAKINGNCKC